MCACAAGAKRLSPQEIASVTRLPCCARDQQARLPSGHEFKKQGADQAVICLPQALFCLELIETHFSTVEKQPASMRLCSSVLQYPGPLPSLCICLHFSLTFVLVLCLCPASRQHLSSILADWFRYCLKPCEKVSNPLEFSVRAQGASCKL